MRTIGKISINLKADTRKFIESIKRYQRAFCITDIIIKNRDYIIIPPYIRIIILGRTMKHLNIQKHKIGISK